MHPRNYEVDTIKHGVKDLSATDKPSRYSSLEEGKSLAFVE